MAIDLYNTRTMMQALFQLKPPRRFILDTIFRQTEEHITETVDIDIQTAKRRLAPFTDPNQEGKVIEKRGYKTLNFKPAYVKPKMVTTAEDLLRRMAGEALYMTATDDLQIRAMTRLTMELNELNDMITRREEWMAARAIQDGKIHVQGEDVDYTLDFGMKATHQVAPTILWSTKATADPQKDIRTWRRLIQKDTGLAPTDLIIGSDVMDALLACSAITSSTGAISTVKLDTGTIAPDIMPEGITYVGRLRDSGVDIWTYDEWFVDPFTDVEGPMIDPKKAILIARNGRFVRHYGAIKDIQALQPFARFPKSWVENDPSVRYVMVQSAPLPAAHQIDAVYSATVVA